MRILFLSGRVVNDAQKLASKSGREYMTFRFANNEFRDKKDENGNPITHWYRVTTFNRELFGLLNHIKKGKPLNIIGEYSDDIYTNRNTGQCDITRDIIAFKIEFINTGIGEGNNGSAAPQQVSVQTQTRLEPQQQPQPPVQASTAQIESEVQKTTTAYTPADDDDLPF